MRPPLNRIPVTLRIGCRETDRDQGGYDTSRRAPNPRRAARGVEATARVQWCEQVRRRERPSDSGNEPTSVCYLLMRTGERTRMEATAGVSLAVGDQVTVKAGVNVSFWVVEIRDTAHQQSHRGPTLIQVLLSDRSPDPGAPG